MNVVICDDNAEFMQLFKHELETQFALRDWLFQCKEYQSGQDLLKTDLTDVHAIFLDIDMPGMNGIQVAQRIRKKYPEIVIVFVTAFLQYAVEGYSVEALRYLLKGDLSKDLPACLDAIQEKVFTTQESILLRTTSDNITMRLKDILYFEGTPHPHTIVHTQSGRKIDCMGKISEYEALLFEKGFLRIQRSYLVNSMYIIDLCSYTATLKNGETLSISRKQYLCLSKGKCSKRARKRRAEAAPEIEMDNVDEMTVEAEGAGMHTFWCSFGVRNRKQEAQRAQLHTFW